MPADSAVQQTGGQPTEQPLPTDDADSAVQSAEASAQDAASVYTPTGDTGTQAAQAIPIDQAIPAGSPADNDAASLEAESTANADLQAAAEGGAPKDDCG